MKCQMGHFGQPLDSKEIVQERIQERQPAMMEFYGDDYIIESPLTEYYYSNDELEASGESTQQLEAEAQTAKVVKTDAATAVSKASSPEKKEPNRKLIYGGLATLAALWYYNQD